MSTSTNPFLYTVSTAQPYNSTTDLTTTCQTTLEELPSTTWKHAFGCVLFIVSILALVENGILMILFYRHPKLRKPSNKILASIVVADWLTGLTVGPLYGLQLLSSVLHHDCFVHKFRRVCGVFFMGASLSSIFFLTIDRSLRLVKKLNTYSLKDQMLYGCTFACWFFPLVVAMVGLLSDQVHSASVSILGVGIIVLILTCYAVAMYALKKHRSAMGAEINAQLLANERRAMKMVLIILTCFFLMLLPMLVEKALYAVGAIGNTPVVHIFAVTLFIGNSAVNPVIYASRLPMVLEYGRRLFCGTKNRQEGADSRESTSNIHLKHLSVTSQDLLKMNVNGPSIRGKLQQNERSPMLP